MLTIGGKVDNDEFHAERVKSRAFSAHVLLTIPAALPLR